MFELPDAALLRELFDYNPASGELFWRRRPRRHFQRDQDWRRWNNQFSGKVAGNARPQPGGRFNAWTRITHNGSTRRYLNHRIIWKWMTGEDPFGRVIDHINQNPADNSWGNIRLVDLQVNATNCRKSKRNTSGVVGVSWDKKMERWVAKICFKGVRYRVGTFRNLDDAREAVSARYKEMGFSDLHGS